jgi:hypothetical protein
VANPVNATTAQLFGICPQSGTGAATSALLTGINALGCIANGTTRLIGANAAEQRFDTRCGKSDR